MRKIALLRAVGAQKSQICSMLFWEAVYLLCIGLPFGLLLGLLSAYGVVTYINRFHGICNTPDFAIGWPSLWLSIYFSW